MNNLALSEQTPVGSVVYKLEGYDPEGGNVSFGLIGSDNFIVDPVTGDVQVIKELDREVSTVRAPLRPGDRFALLRPWPVSTLFSSCHRGNVVADRPWPQAQEK